MHRCVGDANHALRVLHGARDNLLKYLGKMEKSELERHGDVVEEVFAMTGRLVEWYKQEGAEEGAGERVEGDIVVCCACIYPPRFYSIDL